MKSFIAFCLLLSQAAAFSVAPRAAPQRCLFAGDYEPMEGESKINLKIDLDSPKVATMDDIEKGKKVYCRCWLSGTFPLCDGACPLVDSYLWLGLFFSLLPSNLFCSS